MGRYVISISVYRERDPAGTLGMRVQFLSPLDPSTPWSPQFLFLHNAHVAQSIERIAPCSKRWPPMAAPQVERQHKDQEGSSLSVHAD